MSVILLGCHLLAGICVFQLPLGDHFYYTFGRSKKQLQDFTHLIPVQRQSLKSENIKVTQTLTWKWPWNWYNRVSQWDSLRSMQVFLWPQCMIDWSKKNLNTIGLHLKIQKFMWQKNNYEAVDGSGLVSLQLWFSFQPLSSNIRWIEQQAVEQYVTLNHEGALLLFTLYAVLGGGGFLSDFFLLYLKRSETLS